MSEKPQISVSITPTLLDKRTTAQMLGNISVYKLEELLREGRIVAKTIDKRVLFEPSEIARFTAACPPWEPGRATA